MMPWLIGWAILAGLFLVFNFSAHRKPRVVVDHDAVIAEHFPDQEIA